MDPAHERLARIGLAAAERYGFALAGGYAVQAHGILDRPSEDVDLFTGWDRRDEFAAARDAVVAAYQDSGYVVDVVQEFETFARLQVAERDADDVYRVELVANWRSQRPIRMAIGPVLHLDDVVAGKMSALYSRAEPRDFLDVDAILATGSHTRERLCELARQADAGFDERMLAELMGMQERYPDRRFAAYGATPERIAGLRARFREWRADLLLPTEQDQSGG